MTRFPILSAKEVIRVLRSIDFEDAPKRGKGSHIAMVKREPGKARLVIIPNRKTLLFDPDHGRELKEEIELRLQASQDSKERFSLEEVKGKLGHI